VDGADAESALANPPPGCAFRRTAAGFEVEASTRGWQAVMLIPFALAWNAFLVNFFGGFLGGLLSAVGEAQQGAEEAAPADDGGEGMAIGFVIFICLFMVPFVVVGLGMIGAALMSLLGTVRVSVDRGQGRVFAGIGRLGRSRKFDWEAVRKLVPIRPPGQPMPPIGIPGLGAFRIDADRKVKVGRMLTQERGQFMVGALRAMLAERDQDRRGMF
jgi:hypothetical protein